MHSCNLYLYNMPMFQCALHCISAHCYTTHAHIEGNLTLWCKFCGMLHLPLSLPKNDDTVVQPYVTILHVGIILLINKSVIYVIYSSKRLHIYIYIYSGSCLLWSLWVPRFLITITGW
jgi:hypothetical protein